MWLEIQKLKHWKIAILWPTQVKMLRWYFTCSVGYGYSYCCEKGKPWSLKVLCCLHLCHLIRIRSCIYYWTYKFPFFPPGTKHLSFLAKWLSFTLRSAVSEKYHRHGYQSASHWQLHIGLCWLEDSLSPESSQHSRSQARVKEEGCVRFWQTSKKNSHSNRFETHKKLVGA